MPAHASFTVNDRATTPVAHTYTPVGIDNNGVASWKEVSGVPVGEKYFTLSNKLSNGKYRVKLLFKYPIVQTQTINGISTPVVVRTAYGELNLTFDQTSSLQERQDTVGQIYNSMAASQTMLDGVLTALGTIY
jgi:hypothetical protein